MADFVLKAGQGNIWPNKRKTEPKHPDITGKANIDGKLFWISGWHKTTQAGVGWYSLAFKPMDESAQMDAQTGAGQADNPGF